MTYYILTKQKQFIKILEPVGIPIVSDSGTQEFFGDFQQITTADEVRIYSDSGATNILRQFSNFIQGKLGEKIGVETHF